MPAHCRPWFLDRLLHLCPTAPSMLSKGQHVLRAWNEGCGVSIDGSERSHAQHRTDMKSNGRARSSTVAANRVFVQSVRADMIRRGMRDPGLPPSALSSSSSSGPGCSAVGGEVPGARQQQQKRPGGNPEFLNHSWKIYQQTFSPNLPMSAEARQHVQEQARGAWGNMSSDEQGLWRCIHVGRSTNMRHQVGEGQRVASTNDDKARPSRWACLVYPPHDPAEI